MPWSLEEITHLMEERIPFNRWLGMRLVEGSSGRCVLRVPFREELVGDSSRPALHGGVVSTLVDTAGGCAAFLAIEKGQRVSTVDLVVDYLRPGPLADIEATATVVRKGNRVCTTVMEVRAVGHDEVIALGRAVYSIHGLGERALPDPDDEDQRGL